MDTRQCHRRSIKFALRVFGHDYEIELVSFGASNQLGKSSRAVAAQRRVHVNDTLIVGIVSDVLVGDSLGRKLLNSVSQTAEPVAAIREGNLGQDNKRQQNDEYFSARHFADGAFRRRNSSFSRSQTART